MKRDQLLDAATALVVFVTLAVGASAIRDRAGSSVTASVQEDRDVSKEDWEALRGAGNWIGTSSANVVVVEFVDYECPFCRRIAPHVRALRDVFLEDVAVVYRHLPLPIHPNAYFAARLAECAATQGRFEAAHDMLNEILSLENIDVEQFAQILSVPDETAFIECARDGADVPRIQDDLAMARSVGANRTPSFVINGVLQGQALDSTRLFNLVRDLLEEGIDSEGP